MTARPFRLSPPVESAPFERIRATLDETVAILKDSNDAADAAIAATPIQLDLEAAARKIKQRGPRLFVGEISAMDRLHSALIDAMQPHVQSAFSVFDLVSALHDAGCDFEEEAGEVSVSFGAGTDLTDSDVMAFYVHLSLAAPRYAEAILNAAVWNEAEGAFFWDTQTIARRAAA